MNTTIDNARIGFLFDLDGVLIDSETEYSRIWTEIDRKFHSGYDDLATRIKGTTLDSIIDTYFPHADRQAIIDMLYDLEGKMVYRWLPGALDILRFASDHQIPTVLVTSSNDVKMAHLHEEIPDFDHWFDHIVTADMISRSKPDPEGYLLGAKLIGARPEHCAVFEDSYQGVQAGNASGAYVVGVAGTLPAERIQPFSDIIVHSLEELDFEDLSRILASREP